MTAVGVSAGGREHGVEVGLVGLRVVLLDPAEVAGLRRRRRVGRDGLGDLVPGLAALQVRERLIGLRLGGCLLGGRRFDRALVGLGLDLDDPGVTGLRDGGLGGQAGIDVRVGDRDALLGRELRLELRVDEPLEGDGGDLLLLLRDDLELGLRLRLGHVAGERLGPDPALRLAESPAFDVVAVEELVLRDRLAIDAADRREVVVVPGQAGGDEEDDDRDDDDQAEADVHVEAASVLALPRRAVGALDDGFGSKGHLT